MSDEIKLGDRFYPSDDLAVIYTVSSVSRFAHRITHVTLTAMGDHLAIRVSIGEIQDTSEWMPAK